MAIGQGLPRNTSGTATVNPVASARRSDTCLTFGHWVLWCFVGWAGPGWVGLGGVGGGFGGTSQSPLVWPRGPGVDSPQLRPRRRREAVQNRPGARPGATRRHVERKSDKRGPACLGKVRVTKDVVDQQDRRRLGAFGAAGGFGTKGSARTRRRAGSCSRGRGPLADRWRTGAAGARPSAPPHPRQRMPADRPPTSPPCPLACSRRSRACQRHSRPPSLRLSSSRVRGAGREEAGYLEIPETLLGLTRENTLPHVPY